MYQVLRIERVLRVIKANGDTVYYDDNPYLDAFEGYLAVSRKGRWTFIDEDGEEVCEPQYEDVDYFREGFAGVKLKDWGFINTSGKEICALRYTAAGEFVNGHARVKRAEKWTFINTDGEEICEPRFDDVCDFDEEGRAYVRWDSSWGWLYASGEVSWQGNLELQEYFE